jgi:hypothetical protein
MEPRVILPLGLFLALLALFLVVLQRASRLVATTREHERFQRAILDLDRRFGQTLDPLISRLDEIRRHAIGPEELGDALGAATEDLRRAVDETRALRGPLGLTDVPSAFVRELERAERAVGLAEHGRSGLVANRGGPRELEAQTSLKRAALNLRNAREAASTIAHRVELALPPGAQRARDRSRRRRLASEPAIGVAPAADLRQDEGPDPSM